MKCKIMKAVDVFGEEAQREGIGWPNGLPINSKIMVLYDRWAFIEPWVQSYVVEKKLSHLETLAHLNCTGDNDICWGLVRDSSGGVCTTCNTRPPRDVDTLACLLTEGLK